MPKPKNRVSERRKGKFTGNEKMSVNCNFKCEPGERKKWQKAADTLGVTHSEFYRSTLNAQAKKVLSENNS